MKYLLFILLIACSKPELEANPHLVGKDTEIGRTVNKGSIITFYSDSLGEWEYFLNEAIAEWNGLNTSLKFKMGTKESHTTRIVFSDTLSSAALANLPSHKNEPGALIQISVKAKYYKKLVLMHEIGHVVGLMHIESRRSVMNTRDRYGFQKEDSLLIKKLFL
jgi:hypothetical protein